MKNNSSRDKIVCAIIDDDPECMAELLSNDVESINNITFNFNDSSGYRYPKTLLSKPNLLMLAAYFGSEECFKYLVSCGCQIRAIDWRGRSISMYACSGGNMNIIHYLHSEGLSFETDYNSKITYAPSYQAIKYGNLDAAKYLYVHGEKFDSKEIRTLAFSYGYMDIITFFIEQIPLENEESFFYEYIIEACCNGHSEVVFKIFDVYKSRKYQKFTKKELGNLLDFSISSGLLSTVKAIFKITKSLYPSAMKYMYTIGLEFSSSTKYLDIVNFFIKSSEIKNINDPLIGRSVFNAIASDNITVMKMFFSTFGNFESVNKVLFSLIIATSLEMIDFLLSKVNMTIEDHLQKVFQIAINNKDDCSMLRQLADRNYSFELATDSMLKNSTNLSKLRFLVEQGANIKFTPENGVVNFALKSLHWSKLYAILDIGCKLNNELIYQSGCLYKKIADRNSCFYNELLIKCEDLNFHIYPNLFPILVELTKKSSYSFYLLETAIAKGCIIDGDFIKEEIKRGNQYISFPDMIRTLIIKRRDCKWDLSLKGGNVDIPLDTVIEFLSESSLEQIINQRPKLQEEIQNALKINFERKQNQGLLLENNRPKIK